MNEEIQIAILKGDIYKEVLKLHMGERKFASMDAVLDVLMCDFMSRMDEDPTADKRQLFIEAMEGLLKDSIL